MNKLQTNNHLGAMGTEETPKGPRSRYSIATYVNVQRKLTARLRQP